MSWATHSIHPTSHQSSFLMVKMMTNDIDNDDDDDSDEDDNDDNDDDDDDDLRGEMGE